MRHQFRHVNLLHQTADLASRFVRRILDDRVMGHALDLPFRPVQGDFQLGYFTQGFGKFFTQAIRSVIHDYSLRAKAAAFLAAAIRPNLTPPHQIPLLIFFGPRHSPQKLTCTLRPARGANVLDSLDADR
jgi:hypothetical protein